MKALMDTLRKVQDEFLNTVGMLFVLGMFYVAPFLSLVLTFLLLFTPFLPILLLYFLWLYLDRNTPHREGRRIQFVTSLLHGFFQRFRNYFPMRFIKTADLPATKNYIFALFPHGILSVSGHGIILGGNTEFERLFPGIRITAHTLNIHFYVPFSREYDLSIGFRSASKEALLNALTEGTGRASALVIGGSAEALYSKPGVHRVVLKDRKGFIKLAIITGVDLVPIYAFGENEVYDQYIFPKDNIVHKMQQKFRILTGIAPVLIKGRGVFPKFFGLLPKKQPIFIVVGKPIPVAKNEKPSSAEIEALHKIFIQELTNLFNKYKYYYLLDPEKAVLTIV